MKITVIGAGAVGGYIGALLKQDGNDVTFIARGKHLEKMREKGLTLKHQDGVFTVYERFTDEFTSIIESDLLIFTVKSTETKKVCEQIKPYIKKKAYILTFQNGVINEDILSGNFGKDFVIPGSAYISANVEEYGSITQSGNPRFFIGNLTETQKDFINNVIEIFQKAGINSKFTSEIMKKKWEKTLWNVTFNPLSAVTRATVGQILDDSKLRSTSEAIHREIVKIAKDNNVEISKEAIEIVFKNAENARNHKTSMLQDLERGKKMEVEALCGYFVKLAERNNTDVPVLSAIYSILSFIDQKEQN